MHSLSFLSILFLLVAVTVAAQPIEADRPLDFESLYEVSAFWPVRAALTTDWTSPTDDARTIPAGREGVLIRLEPGEPILALVDFNRLGLHRVPVEQTDVAMRAEKIRSGEIVKEFPNWSMMLGRGFSKIAPVTGAQNIEVKALLPYRHLLIVYFDTGADTEAMQAVAKHIEADRELYAATDTFTVIYPREDLAATGLGPLIRAMKANGLSAIPFMAPHVAEPYAQSIDHRIPRYPSVVLSDVEGKTLYEPGTAPIELEAMFEEVRRTLSAVDARSEPSQ